MPSFDQEAFGCLFGYPIAHSMSPLLHQTAFDENDIKWKFSLLESRDIEVFLRFLKNPNCLGAAPPIPLHTLQT